MMKIYDNMSVRKIHTQTMEVQGKLVYANGFNGTGLFVPERDSAAILVVIVTRDGGSDKKGFRRNPCCQSCKKPAVASRN